MPRRGENQKPKVLFADPGIPDITKMGPSIALKTWFVVFSNNTLSKSKKIFLFFGHEQGINKIKTNI